MNASLVVLNLNGEAINAKGAVKIYKLEAPKQVLRKRPWSAPDYKLQTKETFKTQFPYEAYDNESNINQWKKGALVFDKPFDTGSSNKLDLGNIKKWKSGAYIIVLESKDKFGQLIKDEVRTTLFSPKDKTIADNQLFSTTTDKNNYKPNDTATITIGSAAKDIVVFVEVEKNKDIISKRVFPLKNNKKSFSVPVTEKSQSPGISGVYGSPGSMPKSQLYSVAPLAEKTTSPPMQITGSSTIVVIIGKGCTVISTVAVFVQPLS